MHQEYYGLHDNAIELAKVSRVLLAAYRSKGEKFKGKRLNEIQVDERFDLSVFVVRASM